MTRILGVFGILTRSLSDSHVNDIVSGIRVNGNIRIGQSEGFANGDTSNSERCRCAIVSISITVLGLNMACAVIVVLYGYIDKVYLTGIGYYHTIIDGFTDIDFRLVSTLHNREALLERDISFRTGARNFHIDLVGRNIRIMVNRLGRVFALSRILRVFGVRTGNMNCRYVFKDVRSHIGDTDSISIVDDHIAASRNRIDGEYTILIVIASAIHCEDASGEVILVSQSSILNIVVFAIVYRYGIGDSLTRLCDSLVCRLPDGDNAIIRLLHIDCIGRDIILLTIVRVLDGCGIFHNALIGRLYRIGINDIKSLTGIQITDSPSTVSVIGIAVRTLSRNITRKVVMVCDSDIVYGFVCRILHRNGVGHNIRYLGNILIGILFNIDRRCRVFHNSSVQDLRSISGNYHIGKVKRYALASLYSADGIGVVAVIRNAIHGHKVERSVAIEEVFDHNIFRISLALVGDSNRIVERIANLSFCLINGLGDFDYRNLCFGFRAGNFHINLVGRNLRIGVNGLLGVFTVTRIIRVFGIRAGNMDCCNVFENLRGHISNFNRIGVVDNHITACGNLIDCEFAVLEGVICTVNAYDFASKVVGVGQTSVFDVVILSVMNRDGIGYNLTRLSLCLICSLADGDNTIIGLFDIDGVRGDIVICAIFAVSHICNVFDDGGILSLHRIGVGDIDGLASGNSRDSPRLIAIVSVLVSVFSLDFALEVVSIGDSYIVNRLRSGVLHGNRVGYNLIYLCNVLVGFLLDINRRCRVFDYCGVQYERFVSFNYNIAETKLYALPCLDRRNSVGVVSVICHTIHGLEVQRSVSVKEILNQDILSIRVTAVLDSDGVV